MSLCPANSTCAQGQCLHGNPQKPSWGPELAIPAEEGVLQEAGSLEPRPGLMRDVSDVEDPE